jgi:hypothetical protein
MLCIEWTEAPALVCNDGNEIQILNSILYSGPKQIEDLGNSSITVGYSNVRGGWPGQGNINAYPEFAGEGHWFTGCSSVNLEDDTWVEGNYRLLETSPCIDSGLAGAAPSTDIEGKVRPQGAGPDMGAYEGPAILQAFRRGDGNMDGTVNIADVIFVLGYLKGQGTPPACLDTADANDDGSLDIADPIAILRFLFTDNSPLPEPFEACGVDPTVDVLTCEFYSECPTPEPPVPEEK